MRNNFGLKRVGMKDWRYYCLVVFCSFLFCPHFSKAEKIVEQRQIYLKGVPHVSKNGRILNNYDPALSLFPVFMYATPLDERGILGHPKPLFKSTLDYVASGNFNTIYLGGSLKAKENIELLKNSRYDFPVIMNPSIVSGFGSGDGWTIYGAAWTEGKIGKALSFDGNGDYVTRSSLRGDSLNPLKEMTIEAWIYTKEDKLQTIICRNGPYSLHICGNKQVKFGIFAGSPLTWDFHCSGANTVSLNTWHHVAGVYDNTNLKIYIDGSLKHSGKHSKGGNMEQSARTVDIGYGTSGCDNYFNGIIDGVRIYNRALNGDEIKENYGIRTRSSLVLQLNFEEGSGNVAHDTSEKVDETGYYPQALAWVADEEIGQYLVNGTIQSQYSSYLEKYDRIKRINRNSLVTILDNIWVAPPVENYLTGWSKKWSLDSTDIFMFDFYHFRNDNPPDWTRSGPFGIVGVMQMLTSYFNETKPIWPIVGVADYVEPLHPDSNTVFRSPGQIRAEVFLWIIKGATGIGYFTFDWYWSREGNVIGIRPDTPVSYDSGFGGYKGELRKADQELMNKSIETWNAVKKINAEIAKLTPVILQPSADVRYEIIVDKENRSQTPVYSMLKAYGKKWYLFLVNVDSDNTYSVSVRFKDRKTSYSTIMRPYEAKVEVIDLEGT
jgi:hypothetical protein